jgi:hypothetical protein
MVSSDQAMICRIILWYLSIRIMISLMLKSWNSENSVPKDVTMTHRSNTMSAKQIKTLHGLSR